MTLRACIPVREGTGPNMHLVNAHVGGETRPLRCVGSAAGSVLAERRIAILSRPAAGRVTATRNACGARGRLWRGCPRVHVMAGLCLAVGASLPRQHRAGAVRRWSPGTYPVPVD
jgi:hypothetical protein